MSDEQTPIRLGFTRGVSPSKWAARWKLAAPGSPLELLPIETPYGHTDRKGHDLTEDCDVVIERVAPSDRPVTHEPADGEADTSLAEESARQTHHTMRLYEESVALIVARDSELAEHEEIHLGDLALVKILDYPGHAPEWPAAEAWADPSWMPKSIPAALKLVATGLGGIIAPLPLARHLTDKREHAILRIVADDDSGENALPGSTVWATWRVDRDAVDVQQLAGVMRGRTAQSSRPGIASDAGQAGKKQTSKTKQAQAPAKKKPVLKPNSRGAQLAAAKEKAERAKAEKRRAKKR